MSTMPSFSWPTFSAPRRVAERMLNSRRGCNHRTLGLAEVRRLAVEPFVSGLFMADVAGKRATHTRVLGPRRTSMWLMSLRMKLNSAVFRYRSQRVGGAASGTSPLVPLSTR
jgi:hypothetical protein